MIADMVDSVIGVFNIVGVIIGIFAILVGAFSIANIMFVSVSERTNIIGKRLVLRTVLSLVNSYLNPWHCASLEA